MSLSFTVSVRVRTHANGTVTASIMGPAPLVAWGFELDQVREDLELALVDRIERTHPSLLHRFQAPRGREHVEVEVPQLVELMAEEPIATSRVLDVLVEPEGKWRNLWIPKLDARLWISEEDDLEARVIAFAQESVSKATTKERLALRPESGMTLETLVLEAQLPPLEAFTGDNTGKMLLPEPAPVEDREAEEAAQKKVATPTLDDIGIEVTSDQAVLRRARGRDREVADLLRMLDKPGAVIAVVGPTGCGKSALIDEVAVQLEGRRGWFVDASRLVTADIFSGGWRKRTLDTVTELLEAEGVWFVGSPLELLDAGKHVGSDMNAAQLLKPFLSSGKLRVLAECSEAEWGRMGAKDAGFARLFTPYRVVEPPTDEVRSILDAVSDDLTVKVDRDGLDATLELARRYGPPEALLGTACHFLRRLTDEARARSHEGILGRSEVIDRFCAETGLPPVLVRDEVKLDPDAVRDAFRSRLVGQDAALEHMVDLIAVIKGGMSDLDRPLGSFLFVGPTGVGKTETAKALASWLFGREDRMVRFDMSEFSGPDCLQRLLDPESGLVTRVRQNPFCVVLLDEIEKAHSGVFDLLLQVLGEARLADGSGTTADFRNAVVLMTSNLGVGSFRRPTGFGADLATALRDHVMGEVERFFRPEFFNRIDRVVPFESLGADAITGIAGREIAKVSRREGLRGRGVALEFDPAVTGFLAERGVDVQFGARPLKRAIQTHLTAPLARHLSGSGMPTSIRVGVDGPGLTFANGEAQGTERNLQRLRGLVQRCELLRYRSHCWLKSIAASRAKREVDLVARLLSAKRFWKDHQAADARERASRPKAEALEALRDAHEQILAAEELAHEAWLARDLTQVGPVSGQCEDVERALIDAALQLAGCHRARPDRAWMAFTSDDSVWASTVVQAYARIAIQRGWELSARPGKLAKLDFAPGDPDERFLVKLRKVRECKWVLRFTGPHAAALLAGEVGGHQYRQSSDNKSRMDVVFGEEPVEPPEGLPNTRLYDRRKKIAKNLATGRTTTLHSALHKTVFEMMRLSLYTQVFGTELGGRLWKGASWS